MKIFVNAVICGAIFGIMDIPWWSKDWWKPKDKRRDLIRAAALIVAEIERLDRKIAMTGSCV